MAAVQEYLANASSILSGLREAPVAGTNTTRVNGLRSTVEAAAEALASSGNVSTTLAVLRSGLADISKMGQEVVRAAFGARDNAAGPVLAALAGPSMMSTTQPSAAAAPTKDAGSLAAALEAIELRSTIPTSTNSSSGDLVLNNSTAPEVNATAPAMEASLNATTPEQGPDNSTAAGTSEAASNGSAPQEALDADGDEPAASGEQAPAESGEAPAASGRRRRLHRRALLWG